MSGGERSLYDLTQNYNTAVVAQQNQQRNKSPVSHLYRYANASGHRLPLQRQLAAITDST